MGDRVARNEAVFRSQLDARLGDVYAFLRRLRVDHATAQDLAQETFVTAWQDLPTLRDAGKLRPWLYRIAYRRFLRHKGERAEMPLPEGWPAGPQADPGSEERLNRHVVLQALRELPEAYGHPLVLLYWEELSYAEAARVLSLPLGTFAWRVHRGLSLLKQTLAAGRREDEAPSPSLSPAPDPLRKN